MLALFNKYKVERPQDAVWIGRNLFNRNPANKEVFEAYYDYLCFLAKSLPSHVEQREFAGQAGVALAFFSENVELDDSLIADIDKYQRNLTDIFTAIGESERKKAEREYKKLEANNDNCFKKLLDLKETLRGAATQDAFDKTLAEIGAVDGKINKDMLIVNAEQNEFYDKLTKECTDLISSKMREFEYKKNVAYNKQAANSFAKAFKQFRDDESKYKNQTQLFTLVSATLFAYDASRLFNETLIYYNHVYSYIFSKFNDDGKLALTRYSIECERKLR